MLILSTPFEGSVWSLPVRQDRCIGNCCSYLTGTYTYVSTSVQDATVSSNAVIKLGDNKLISLGAHVLVQTDTDNAACCTVEIHFNLSNDCCIQIRESLLWKYRLLHFWTVRTSVE